MSSKPKKRSNIGKKMLYARFFVKTKMFFKKSIIRSKVCANNVIQKRLQVSIKLKVSMNVIHNFFGIKASKRYPLALQ